MKIGIYGGSFNPVHKGHTRLAKSLVKQGLVDEVWLLVSPLNPLKQIISTEYAEYDHRLKMTEIAVKNVNGVIASDFENHLPVPSYMITTLTELAKSYPQHDFSLVIGADNWLRFDEWYNSEEIIRKFGIFVYRRPGYDIDEQTLSRYDNVKVVDTPLFDISSTEIRETIRSGHEADKWVNKQVLRYINKYCLYR